MTAENIFKDFDHNPYEAEARERWGDRAVNDSKARHSAMTPAAKQAFMEEYAALNQELARSFDAALPAEHPAVQAAVDRHYKWICASWTPNAESYVGLGRMYVEDPGSPPITTRSGSAWRPTCWKASRSTPPKTSARASRKLDGGPPPKLERLAAVVRAVLCSPC